MKNYEKIKDMIFELIGFEYQAETVFLECEDIFVKYDGKCAWLGGNNANDISRACFLLAYNLQSGIQKFEIRQKRQFKHCGAMIDVSRNGVMKLNAIKKFLQYMAALGMNQLMLYTEDVFEMPEYPYFGYMRGRYTLNELREIDDFANNLGIEVVPCVQTLGHMTQYLQWNDTANIRDTKKILLIDEPETYEFIETIIKTMRKAFRSNKIHIGMDEAHDVGLGNYMKKHGFQNRYELMLRHLNKVYQICKKYEYQPMMWSDMLFRLGSSTDDYYDPESHVPMDIMKDIPDVNMVYWDYYHAEKSFYDSMIKKHGDMEKNIIFAGGIWTWSGFVLDMPYTLNTMIPAMESCIENRVDSVFATMWEDDGCETNHFQAVCALPIFSEYCFRGKECTQKDIENVCEFLTKIPFETMLSISKFHENNGRSIQLGKRLFYSDILINLVDAAVDYKILADKYKKVQEVIKNEKMNHMIPYYNEYSSLLFEIIVRKSEIFDEIKNKYSEQDMNYFRELYEIKLPELKELYCRFTDIQRRQWQSTYKSFGYEVLNLRMGGTIARIDYAMEIIREYVVGERSVIEELEENILIQKRTSIIKYANMVSASVIM